MQKSKKNIFLWLFLVYMIFIVFICGCSVQSGDKNIETSFNETSETSETSEITEITVEITTTTEIIETVETIETAETTETDTEPWFEYDIADHTGFGMIDIFVFGIGKADAILITTENHTVMIDTGETKHGYEIINDLKNRGINKIDYLIITHYDKDHVGGAAPVINRLDVKEIIAPGYGKESKQYDQFINAAVNRGLGINILNEPVRFILDSAEFAVYPSNQEYCVYGGNTNENDDADTNGTINENDFSLVVKVTHGNNNFLFTGDAMAERIGEMLSTEEIVNTEYDFLKAPHHGRYNKRSAEFISAVKPKYAVITCSLEQPADERIISALREAGTEVFLTANGDVYCVSNGETVITAYK